MFVRRLSVALVVGSVLLLLAPLAAWGATPFIHRTFQLHDFDQAILETLGYATGSVSYLREMGAISSEQLAERQKYEPINCNPFFLLREGRVDETGYNCETFFCVGYVRGPKLCKDRDGKAYGGVVEISRRMDVPFAYPPTKLFSEYKASEQTPEMKKRIQELAPVQCRPFYALKFDVVTNEGYECDEIGSYPNYSAHRQCLRDERNQAVFRCDAAERPDEFKIRAELLGHTGSLVVSSSSASSASSLPIQLFPDVIEGRYGYTAILSLAAKGKVRGYADGLFRPDRTINRAEFSKLTIESLFPDKATGETGCFPDVVDQWFATHVCAMKRAGWVSGYVDGRFYPSRTIRREEALKIIVASVAPDLASTATLPPDVPATAWYAPYVRKAVELKLILEPTFRPGLEATRADAAVWIYRADKMLSQKASQ